FAVRIRVPRRDVSTLYRATPNGDGITKVTVNGTAFKPPQAHGYAEIARRWQAGDTIELTLPMPVQRVYGSDKIISADGRPSPGPPPAPGTPRPEPPPPESIVWIREK